jgi:hypothetical protein
MTHRQNPLEGRRIAPSVHAFFRGRLSECLPGEQRRSKRSPRAGIEPPAYQENGMPPSAPASSSRNDTENRGELRGSAGEKHPMRQKGQSMAQNHKVPARCLARSISFNRRLTLRARSRFGPAGAGSSRGYSREYTSHALGSDSAASLFHASRNASLITEDLVRLRRRVSARRIRAVSESRRNVTVSPMSYMVRQDSTVVNGF